MSLMYSNKSIGPITEPCGTPDVTSVMSDRAPLTETRCLRFDRKDVIQKKKKKKNIIIII